MEKRRERLSGSVDKEARNLLRARSGRSSFWHYSSMIGMGGWLFALPVVAGAYLGRYLDRRVESGISWTLSLMLLGIAAGVFNVWNFLFRKDGNGQDRDQP